MSVCLSICLSVSPSNVCIVTKRKNLLPTFLYHMKGWFIHPISVFLWSIKCQHSVWQQRLFVKGIKRGHNRQAAGNLIGGCSWRQSTLPAAGYINRPASSADFRGWYQLLIAQCDIGLSAKRGTVIRENPTRRATYYPAGGGFHRLVENRPDPDAGAG